MADSGAAGLAPEGRRPYLWDMALPRPASPSALIADIKAFFATRGRHHWIAAILALLVPGAIFTAFYLQYGEIERPERVISVRMFSADRTDADIIADQKKAQAKKEADAKRRQEGFQRLANQLGIE
jgi:hypothetical protein